MIARAATVLAAAVLAGCGGSDGGSGASEEARERLAERRERAHVAPAEAPRSAHVPATRGSPAEQRWRNARTDLYRSLNRAFLRLGSAHDAAVRGELSDRDVERAEEALAELRGCSERYAETLAEPPGAAFADAARALGEACALLRRGAAGEARALLEDTEALVAAAETWSRAATLLQQANASLPRPGDWHLVPLPSIAAEVAFSRVEPRLTLIAREILGRDVNVRCWSEDDWPALLEQEGYQPDEAGAFAVLHTSSVNLNPRACGRLAALAYSGAEAEGDALLDVADAVQTLAHELQHLSAGSNEALVECLAMQHQRELALTLGADQAYADRLAETYWEELYPAMPDEYRSAECRPGGTLDRDPEDERWP